MISQHLYYTVDLLLAASKAQLLKRAVLSKPLCDKSVVRAVATLKNINSTLNLQIEFFHTDNKATHKNIKLEGESVVTDIAELISNYGQLNIITTVGSCELKRSSSGKETLIGGQKLDRAIKSGGDTIAPGGNDKEKNHILIGNEPFLIALGVSDKNGRPHDKKRPKLRQINRFLEYVRDYEKYLPNEDELTVCDLCCGKSYLSFAVYHYFANVKGRKIKMIGVDLKQDVIEYCNSVARSVGFDGLDFICGDVSAFEPKELPQLVVSLHACDTATDLVLEKAVRWNTKVILATPCCHHEMNHKLNCPTLSFIAEHSMLRQKFCDAATDALRLKMLQSEGYSTEAVELVDPDDTPKNILLRAVLTGKPSKKIRAEYLEIRRFLYGDNYDIY